MNTKKINIHWPAVLFMLTGLEGMVCIWFLIQTPSEGENAWIFGLSTLRAGLAAGALVLALACMAAAIFLHLRRQHTLPGIPPFWLFVLFTGLLSGFAACIITTALAFSPLDAQWPLLYAIAMRGGPLLIWALLAFPQVGLALYTLTRDTIKQAKFLSPLKVAILAAAPSSVYVFAAYLLYKRFASFYALRETIFLLAGLLLLGLAWGLAAEFFRARTWWPKVSHLFLLIFIWGGTATLYMHLPAFFNWTGSPSKSYWHLLADAFLKGRMYLIDPPSQHDLTLYNGQWFVPNPPMPALVILPYTLAVGVEKVSTTFFSALFGGLNATLIFLILEQIRKREWIQLSRGAIIWLTILFALGTPHFWLGGNGQMWFLSQILTLTFCALATWMVLKQWSPWLVGIALGMAVGARSNVFVLWPFLLALHLQITQEKNEKFDWKYILGWMIRSAVPVVLAVAGLMLYNQARFNNPLDFGYATLNGDPTILKDIQTYGMFSPHFLVRNLQIMFCGLPNFNAASFSRWFPQAGISMFITTPALFCLIARYPRRWWTGGAWLSVILSIGLLAMYHNSGANQFGYRYLLDFVVPLWMLLALSLGKKPRWWFYALTLASVAINILGLIWTRFQ